MKHRQIQSFRAVMQYGTITAAARAIGITQPAVSRLIADLEHSVSFALFERRGGKLLPTREAMEFFDEVERMYYGMEQLERVADEIRQLRRADLRVATMPMVSFQILPTVLSDFIRAFDGVRITHNVHTSARVIDLVASRQYELGIAQVHGARQDIEVLASFRAQCICVMAPGHPLAGKSVLTPRDLDAVPMVALTRESLTGRHVYRALADAGVRPDIVIESQPSFAACALSAAGIGIAIVDPLTPISFGSSLIRVPLRPLIPFDFHVLKPTGLTLSRAGEMFRDRMIHAIEAMEHVSAI